MRIIAILLIAVILLITAGIYMQFVISQTAEKIKNDTEELEELILTERWEKAQNKMKALKRLWKNTENKWDVILDHQDRDQISISIARLSQYVSAKNKALSLGEIGIIKELIMHIPLKERINLKNIF